MSEVLYCIVPYVLRDAESKMDMPILIQGQFVNYYLTFTGTASIMREFANQQQKMAMIPILTHMALRIWKAIPKFDASMVSPEYLLAFLPFEQIVEVIEIANPNECPHIWYVSGRVMFDYDLRSCADHMEKIGKLDEENTNKYNLIVFMLNARYNLHLKTR